MYTENDIKNIDFSLPTVLFTDTESSNESKKTFQTNLTQFLYLLNSGYKNYIVDYGTDYGYYALKQLKRLQDYYTVNIISVKLIGEPAAKSGPSILLDAASCDCCLGAVPPISYLELIKKCSCISTSDGLIPSKGEIPGYLLRKLGIHD